MDLPILTALRDEINRVLGAPVDPPNPPPPPPPLPPLPPPPPPPPPPATSWDWIWTDQDRKNEAGAALQWTSAQLDPNTAKVLYLTPPQIAVSDKYKTLATDSLRYHFLRDLPTMVHNIILNPLSVGLSQWDYQQLEMAHITDGLNWWTMPKSLAQDVQVPLPPPLILPPLTPPGRELYWCYFAGANTLWAQIADHSNLAFIGSWANDAKKQLLEAKAAGFTKAMLVTDRERGNPAALRALFTDLKSAGVLGMVCSLYPVDEPDQARLSDEQVTTENVAIRAVAAEFPELAGVKLAVVYAQDARPGFASYDWVGFDDYGAGAGVLSRYTGLGPDQKWILVPGGCDPWRQDPAPFVAFANANPSVVCIMPFLWVDGAPPPVGKGIGQNGMAPAYVAAAKSLIPA